MKERKMNIVDLENNITDGIRIEEMLGSQFDLLRSDELGQSYNRNEDERLNRDFKNYLDKEIEKERRRVRKEEGY